MAENKGLFQKGNRLMMLAERLGRKRDYDAQSLYDEFMDYVQFNIENKVSNTTKLVSKQGTKAGKENKVDSLQKIAPMTIYSFCVWLGKSHSWYATTLSRLEELSASGDAKEEDIALLDAMSRIKTFLGSQMLEGAILGDFNHNIVSSLLGLRNNVDVTSGGDKMDAPIINIIKDTKTREEYKND